ncbi:MAG TPA: hypothetical protein VGX48_24415, partial [Pyrinomonadaceae bacterium]|nr:hypothetical protein [Pyrinomonadaceae bacterium]
MKTTTNPLSRARRALAAAALCLFLGPAADARQPACQPRVRMKTLLDNVGVGPRGVLSIGSLYAHCLPEPARRGATAFAYNPYDGGKLSAVLKASNGQPLNTFVFYAEKIAGLWELSRYEVVGGPQALKPLAVGSYVLDFALEDKVFQRFPFSVSTVESKDVYRPGTVYLLDGPWADYAELYYPKPDRYTQLWVWLRDAENTGPRPREVQYTLRLVRERDGKLIAEGGGATSAMVLRPHWSGYKLSFRPLAVPAGGPAEFHASELLASEGDHRIELSLDGKPYASYRVTVKGGQLQRDPAHARDAA